MQVSGHCAKSPGLCQESLNNGLPGRSYLPCRPLRKSHGKGTGLRYGTSALNLPNTFWSHACVEAQHGAPEYDVFCNSLRSRICIECLHEWSAGVRRGLRGLRGPRENIIGSDRVLQGSAHLDLETLTSSLVHHELSCTTPSMTWVHF